MKLGRFGYGALVALIFSLPVTCTSKNQRLSLNENYVELTQDMHYTQGHGLDLINCVEKTLPSKALTVRKLVGVKDTIIPMRVYTTFSDSTTLGAYYPETQTIAIDTSKVEYDGDSVTCGELAGHELGHFYPDTKSRESGNGMWPVYSSNKKENYTINDWWTKIVSEGFATLISGREFKSKIKWPSTIDEMSKAHHYNLGRNLLSGLVREFGYELLVPIAIKNPATDSEVFHPREWQKRIRNLMQVEH